MAPREPPAPGKPAPDTLGDLDFTRAFTLADLRVPPPAPPVPKTIPPDLMIGAARLAEGGYHVRLARSRPRRSVDRSKITILIIEDDVPVRTLVSVLLGRAGYKTRSAGDGSEFLAAMKQAPLPDLLLLDIQLPDVSGLKILSKVRGHPALRKLPVIIFSASAEISVLTQGIALGADGFLSKPAKASALMEAVEAVLGG